MLIATIVLAVAVCTATVVAVVAILTPGGAAVAVFFGATAVTILLVLLRIWAPRLGRS